MKLPEHVYDTLVAVCEGYPWPTVQDHDHLGEILNAVAWEHREDPVYNAEGKQIGVQRWGLSRKTGGTRVNSPVGEIAEDILQLPDGNHFDVLGGAAQGQPLRPGRANSIGIINLRDRPWVAPVAHTVSWRTFNPPPVDPPPPDNGNGDEPVPQPPPPSVDLGPVLAELKAIHGAIDALSDALFKEDRDSPSMLEHMDDVKRIVLGVPRKERFR